MTKKMKAVVLSTTGGPEVLENREVDPRFGPKGFGFKVPSRFGLVLPFARIAKAAF